MEKKIYSFGDICCIFATVDGWTELIIVPSGYENELNDEKVIGLSPLNNIIYKESLVHLALAGDGQSSPGITEQDSKTALTLKMTSQSLEENDNAVTLVTTLENGEGLIVRQYIVARKGSDALEMYNEVENTGEEVLLEALPSFNISRISPFERFDSPENILIHKMLSNWSGEGKLQTVSADQLAFESSWSGLGIRTLKIEQTGTMPARGHLPFAAVEDVKQGVCWAATIEAPASWEIEIAFRNNSLSMGGGLSDYLTGHWRKYLKNGELMRTNKAYVTVVRGDVNVACDRLVKAYECERVIKPCEEDLPTMYNEWCYTWGTPKAEVLEKILPIAAKLGCKYFVVDDGWFVCDYGKGRCVIGDWDLRKEMFPNGLKAFSDTVNSYGMKLGIWYEFEGVSDQSNVYKNHPDWLHTYQGKIINHNGRAFLDFRKKAVIEYLREKVIKNLIDNNIGYMKVDYNAAIGLGVDGAESYGEGLRQHIESVLAFFEEIKRSVPELVLEICSSGGMRHEPRFLNLADIVSFSDAHECPSGVNIAFNLHRFMPPRKMLIWATIREDYDLEDTNFTVAKAMLGRYCLSGNLGKKSAEIIDAIEESVHFYNDITHIVKDGTTTVIEDSEIKSYLHTKGATYLIRESLDGKEKLLYAFAMDAPLREFKVEIGNYHVKKAFNLPKDAYIDGTTLCFSAKDCPMWGCVVWLCRNER